MSGNRPAAATEAPEQWLWIVVVGAIGAFGFGYGTGANDVANAFGTSIGSGALNNRQAVMIAGSMEFTGAMVLGRVSISVISGAIADRTAFLFCPACYAYGMMWVLWVGTAWLLLTTYYGINVSSTHSIIGGILGFALCYKTSAVLWITDNPASFPPYNGIVPIVVTWLFAPIATGFAAATLFLVIRTLILRSSDSYNRSFYLMPFFIFLTIWVNIYFVFTKGAKKTFNAEPGTKDDWNDDKSAWIAACVAAGCMFLSLGLIPLVKYRAAQLEKAETDAEEAKLNLGKPILDEDLEKKVETRFGVAWDPNAVYRSSMGIFISELKNVNSFATLKQALIKADNGAKESTAEFYAAANENVSEMRAHAEKFDRKTESVFKVLQVFTACAVMFAHGAGEVGYMAGPLATIWEVHITGKLTSSVSAPFWILVLSALSLVIGLATYGQKVTKGVGKDLAMITASRGFCAELCTAIVIMVAAQFGLPTSSSQCITGGVVGIGIMEGAVTGVNWKFLAETISSWILTLFIVGFGTAALFGQGHNSP